ncbi:hypothetical protein Clacol_001608 [Clathrus columnatus]|uniref:Mitochondrial import receptor subunit TOM20 n=1 Tax=Clathrus columnatus TaxID=1419009 RepID=A0AAV5A311_9AGAM|nr:hypothetical protein Clacol_001608 [Clathrus columnatus]
MSLNQTIRTAGLVTAIAALVGYAIYFDYKRRNDVDFRKKLRRQQKKVTKSAIAEQGTSNPEITQAELLQKVRAIKKEKFPTSAEEREQYFTTHVNQAEQLHLRGEELPSALHFYRALCVYPNPTDLLQLYQRVISPPVFKLLIEMWTLGATDTISSDDLGSPETKPKTTASGPSSETSSQEWENLMDSNIRL